jgi:hypothetical protein
MKVTFQTRNDVNMGDSIPRKRTLEYDKIRGRNLEKKDGVQS